MKNEFSDDEWYLLSSTPAAIGTMMSAAAASGVFGTIKELSASMRSTVQGLQTHSDSELIASLLERSDNWSDAKDKASDYSERTKERFKEQSVTSPEALQKFVLEDCKTVASLVEERCSADEADAYKDWCVTIAANVAKASKEGSILGFGGTRISEAEKTQMAEIEALTQNDRVTVKGLTGKYFPASLNPTHRIQAFSWKKSFTNFCFKQLHFRGLRS